MRTACYGPRVRRLTLATDVKTAPWDSSEHPRGQGGKFSKKSESTQRGDKGENVKALQEALNKLGAKPPLAVDGVFGPKTEAALKSFQGQWNIDLSGKVDKDTSEALSLAVDAEGSVKKPKGSSRGSSGSRTSGSGGGKAKPKRRSSSATTRRLAAERRAVGASSGSSSRSGTGKTTRKISKTTNPAKEPAKDSATKPTPATTLQQWKLQQQAADRKAGFADATVGQVKAGDQVVYYANIGGIDARVKGTVADVQGDRLWFAAGSGYATVNGKTGTYKVGGWVSFPPKGKVMRKPGKAASPATAAA